MKLKIGKIDCFIPCRKKGDFINNLNFLELEGIKLVEHSIIIAKKSNLFKNIYIVTNDKESANILVKKYSFLKFIIVKNTQEHFNLMIKKINQKIIDLSSDICVLLPNYPFKSVATIKNIFFEYKKRKTNLMISATAVNNFFYNNKSSFLKAINFSNNIKKRKDIPPLYKVAGGIFFYNKNFQNIKMNSFLKKEIYLLNEHESFGIYSLYDFIKASSLFDIDSSILKKLISSNH
tara:strand:+ start:341 stop:1042 length:702 start_codon:yes stop_codon:yes gene_type:complete